jgi:hypothetical protein
MKKRCKAKKSNVNGGTKRKKICKLYGTTYDYKGSFRNKVGYLRKRWRDSVEHDTSKKKYYMVKTDNTYNLHHTQMEEWNFVRAFVVMAILVLPLHVVTSSDTMQQSPSRETQSRSAGQQILCILCNLHVYFQIHKSMPLVSVLIDLDPIHNLTL